MKELMQRVSFWLGEATGTADERADQVVVPRLDQTMDRMAQMGTAVQQRLAESCQWLRGRSRGG